VNEPLSSWQITGVTDTPIVGLHGIDKDAAIQGEVVAVMDELTTLCITYPPKCCDINHALERLEGLFVQPQIVSEHVQACLAFLFAVQDDIDTQEVINSWNKCLCVPTIKKWLNLEETDLQSIVNRAKDLRIAADQRVTTRNQRVSSRQKTSAFEDIVRRLFPTGSFQSPNLQLILTRTD
jgi:hypothetical protein